MAPKREEEIVYGVAAARAVLNQRPRDVVRMSYEPSTELAGLAKIAAKHGVATTRADERALGAMANAVHHEGICLLVRPRKRVTVDELAGARTLVALDGVGNPHNVGAILRTAAYFGVQGLLIARPPPLPPSAVRIAEGGAEHVALCFVDDLAGALARLRVPVVGAAPRARHDALRYAWPSACAIVLGGERRGLSDPVRAACTDLVTIGPASAHPVESLNVSVAAGILLAARGVS